jgi:flagellar hook-basal body complex protein FliE
MEFTPIRPIEPLFDSLTQPAKQAEENPAVSMFANVFQQAIQNVRDTNATQVDLEYQLATGQIDNPALVTTAITKASTAAELLMQMRNKAVDAYNELMRISL